MSAKQAVEKILIKFKNDSTATKFVPNRKEDFEKMLGMEILEIGEAYKKDGYVGEIVPYKVKLKDGEMIEANMAVRNDNEFKIWILDNLN